MNQQQQYFYINTIAESNTRHSNTTITRMACWTSVLLCSLMFFRILLAAFWRAVTADLDATVRG